MNFNMFSNQQNNDMDPNYIYPRPYIDPMMYINPYAMNGSSSVNPNMNMGYYMTYMNPYMVNPALGHKFTDDNDDDYFSYEDDDMEYMDMDIEMPGAIPNMQGMMMPNMQGMMVPGMMPNMQGMMPMMMPYMQGMMMPGMMPGMPMHPFMPMMNGVQPINIEELDEEEM